jgi:hypothetical protein
LHYKHKRKANKNLSDEKLDENRKRVQPRKAPMIDMSDDENTGERTQI